MTQDPIQRLLDEHVEFLARLQPLRRALRELPVGGAQSLSTALPALREAAHMMTTDLIAHARREDDIFFVAVESAMGGAFGPTTVMRSEHAEIHAGADRFESTLRELQEVDSGLYLEFCAVNSELIPNEAGFWAFVEAVLPLASELGVVPRPAQLAAMFLLVCSSQTHHSTLIQLATGAGKSLMLGLLAQYLNKTTGKKVIVLVPTPFLQLYQETNYCPTASKIPEEILHSDTKHIFYCSYQQFMSSSFYIPSETMLLVDEFHELFFNSKLAVEQGRFISVL